MSDRQAYYREYEERRREDKSDYYVINREDILSRQKMYDSKHKGSKSAYNKAYYQRRRERMLEKAHARYQTHRGEILEQKRDKLRRQKAWLAEYERECEQLGEETSDSESAYTCEDCFYFGAEHEGAFYCALDTEHTHPMGAASCEACFMMRGDDPAWRSMYEKRRL